jgi:opacity protein-like surface antigen
MKSIQLFVLVLMTTYIISDLHAQSLTKSGTSAAQFLKIDVGPRAIGMGGAFTATANDISALYWNPAGLASNLSGEAFFSHTDWFLDIGMEYAGVAVHVPEIGTLGGFVTALTMDDMLVRTEERPEGTGEMFDAGGLAIGLSYARNLTERFSIGFNVKYISEFIWHTSATGFALDVGTIYKIPIKNEFRIGASISNFGTKMKLDGRDLIDIKQIGGSSGNLINTKIDIDEYELPLLFRVGVAMDVWKSDDSRITSALDAIHPNDHTEFVNSGIEYAWNEIVLIRAGYKALFEEDSEQGLTLGFGLYYRVADYVKLKIDYAYQEFGRLTDVHQFSFGIKF